MDARRRKCLTGGRRQAIRLKRRSASAMIFMSYDSRDRVAVARIVDALSEAGLAVWWDQQLEPGTRFSAEIERRLNESQLVIVCWSRHSIASDWVRDEADVARSKGTLFSLLLDDAPPPLGFRGIQSMKVDPGDVAFLPIVRSVVSRLTRPSDASHSGPENERPVSPSQPAPGGSSVVVTGGSVVTGSQIAGRDIRG